MEHQPRVAIVMPVYNEARFLPGVLRSIAAQEFPKERLLFVAVDGCSSDGSADIVRQWLSGWGAAGAVLSNPRRKIPVSLNMAIAYAGATDIVIRLDAHTLYEPTYIAEAVGALQRAPQDVACVGGAQLPLAGTTFAARVVGALYTNPLGLGWGDFRCGTSVRPADSVYLGAWRPGVLAAAGGFNETMEANEDAELAARLRENGYRILRVPLPCRFAINRGPAAAIRQWSRYGYWRAKMLRRHPSSMRIRHLAGPACALAAVVLALSPLRAALLPAAAIYAAVLFRGRAPGEALPVTFAALLFFPAVQCGFAAGMLAGLVAGAVDAWPPAVSSPQAARIHS